MRRLTRPFESPPPRVHATAIVDPTANLCEGVEIGPYAIVEAHARIGARTQVLASAYVAAGTDIGSDCEVHMGAILGHTPQIRGHRGPFGKLVIGDRTIIREYATVHRGRAPGGDTTIGSDNFLLGACHVGHDCRIGDGTTIATGALLAGCVTVGDRAFISGHVAIHQHVRIGALSMIRGMSGVGKDVLPFVIIAGVSDVAGINVVGMRRAGMSAEQRLNVRRAYGVLFRSGTNVSQGLERLRELPPNDEVGAWVSFAAASTRGLCRPRSGARQHGRDRTDQSEI